MNEGAPARFPYRPRHRVGHRLEYAAAFEAKLNKAVGPLVVFGRAAGLAEHRLGLSVGRKVGPAVRRVKIKRLLREAFRLARPGLPVDPDGRGYDLVVRVLPHRPAGLESYAGWLRSAAAHIDATHRRRLARAAGGREDKPGGGA